MKQNTIIFKLKYKYLISSRIISYYCKKRKCFYSFKLYNLVINLNKFSYIFYNLLCIISILVKTFSFFILNFCLYLYYKIIFQFYSKYLNFLLKFLFLYYYFSRNCIYNRLIYYIVSQLLLFTVLFIYLFLFL